MKSRPPRDFTRKIEDIPEDILAEFRARRSRRYVLPAWCYRKGYRKTTVGGKGDE